MHFISDVVDTLDLSAISDAYTEVRGQPPYHPAMMVKVWLYAYSIGIRSSRKGACAVRKHRVPNTKRRPAAGMQLRLWSTGYDFQRRLPIDVGFAPRQRMSHARHPRL